MTSTPLGLITSAASENLLKERRREIVSTPFGEAEVWLGTISGRQSAVILRYGEGLTTPSHKINYKANIWAFRELGVESVVSHNAIGSVNPAIRPGDIVVSDDFLDKTKSPPQSLFDDGACWVRVDFTNPFCPRLRENLIKAAKRHSDRVIERGTFVCTEGPRFETPAEIRAELCFASLAPVINFGAGMAPAVVHFGPGSMNEEYYRGGPPCPDREHADRRIC